MKWGGEEAAGDTALPPFVAALPKVDLHVHLLGSASATTVAALARRRPAAGVPAEPVALRDYLRFGTFARFVSVYTALNKLVTSAVDVATLVSGLAYDLAADNVRYAEVTVTPTSHLAVGVDPVELAEALDTGRRRASTEHGIELAWIFDSSGDDGPAGGWETLRWVLTHRPEGTVGFGLGGPEAEAPRAGFREVFAAARAAGLRSLPHAGETSCPAEVRAAVRELGADRVGHGIAAVGDPRLLADLAERQIPLEVCLTSNLRTGAADSLSTHPLRALVEAGVPVVLGSDDPGLFQTKLSGEYLLYAEALGASASELAELARAGVRAAFCSEGLRRALLVQIDRLEHPRPNRPKLP